MNPLWAEYHRVRRLTAALCAPLEIEDYVVQPMDDVSPPKWHLAHTTWFFETFLLRRRLPGYRLFDESFPSVFNSYYQTVGSPYPRTKRGTLSRPTVKDVLDYRESVDEAMLALIERRPGEGFEEALSLGLNHEQQHQELLVADIKLILAHNPVGAVYPGGAFEPRSGGGAPSAPVRVGFEGGAFSMGRDDAGLVFDNEGPAHATLLRPFLLADRLVVNGEYREFIDAGGYRDFRHWLSDGWDRARLEGWTSPMYWSEAVDRAAPVCHLSWYEADAFARWAGARLPTEAEWERAAHGAEPSKGNFMEDGAWSPLPANAGDGLRQLFGDAWEWTSSPYVPYPGYRAADGAFGEYNGKFMNGQYVLRGGSCATPRGHVRRTYRNFFQPEKRWQFMGVRLAWDA
ncbi:MAG TPA: ergothioneine biosynthesis protein EgtB [Elusimicrobiota bacterium]|nr:ergothioneine biosynthesis protein EgtB [Elusimicrobiota bacterium]